MQNDVKSLLIKSSNTIKEAMLLLDKLGTQFLIVTDSHNKLFGTVTDGDIRRAILRGAQLSENVESIANKNPVCADSSQTTQELLKVAKAKNVRQIIILDKDKNIVRVEFTHELSIIKKDNLVVLMAGGQGSRLRPLTANVPKPMLNVGGKPILETIIKNFAKSGFYNIVLALNYKYKIIQDYFGDGSAFGVNISYIKESEQLGTAGALSLVNKTSIDKPFFLMNADLLTKVNFERFLEFYHESQATACVAVREYDLQVPYGVIKTQHGMVSEIVEKPVHTFFVNAGIYILNPEVLHMVIGQQYMDMPDLLNMLLEQNKKVSSFPIHEYWLDIGQKHDYEKADEEYVKHFNNVEY